MMTTRHGSWCGLFLLAAPLLLCSGCMKPEWKEYVSDSGGYSVLFPGTPKHQSQKVPTPAGDFDLNMAIVEFREMGYTVMHSTMPMEVKTFPQLALEGAQKGLTDKGFKLAKSENIKLGAHPGKEIQGEDASGKHLRVRIYLVENRLYQVMIAATTAERLTDADAEKFYTSFKIK